MSLHVHRCRFLDIVPHAIESLDVESGVFPSPRLAVLRANADIEVWSLRHGEAHCELRLAGMVSTPMRRVVWGARSLARPEGRLFSCGLHGLVTEWDLRKLSPRSSWDSKGGAVWTLAVLADKQLLAAGCEDGSCSIFDTSDELALEPKLVYRTAPQGGRLLCVAFSPQGSHLACAAADGSVRVWHVASWQALSRYTLAADGRRLPPLVWSVLLLSDLTVVTGDSTGRVSFYDGRHGTLLRRFASHHADVLALAASMDEAMLFAAGVDHKIACFSPREGASTVLSTQRDSADGDASNNLAVPSQPPGTVLSLLLQHLPVQVPASRSWLVSSSRRPHTHDVRALTTCQSPNSPPMLLSGGIDTQLCLLPLGPTFAKAAPLKLLPFPHHGAVGVARKPRLLLSHNTAEVQIWQLPPLRCSSHGASSAAVSTAVAAAEEPLAASTSVPRKLLMLRPKLTTRTISCAAISDDGHWLVVCAGETRLYQLGLPPATNSPSVRRVDLTGSVTPAASCLFTRNGRLLILGGVQGVLQAVTLDEKAGFPVHSFRGPPIAGSEQRCALTKLAVSDDGQWISTADSLRRIHLHSLDSLSYSSTVPPSSSPPTALAFLGASAILAVASANKQLTLYDAERRELTSWSVCHPHPIAEVNESHEVPHAIVVHASSPYTPVLCGDSWLCRVDVTSGVDGKHSGASPVPLPEAPPRSGSSKKRRRGSAGSSGEGASTPAGPTETSTVQRSISRVRILRSYGSILKFEYVGDREALVVEQPWLRVMNHFPPAMFRHRFGT